LRPGPTPSTSAITERGRPSGAALSSASFDALGSTATLVVTNSGALQPAREILETELDAIDAAASRFRSDSELTRVNSLSGTPVPVSPLFIEALGVALHAAELTGGDVDPTLGSQLAANGYDRDWSELTPVPTNVAARDGSRRRVRSRGTRAWSHIEIDRGAGTVALPAGAQLDLGATAKALAADRAAARIHDRLGCGVLVSLGGDVATAGAAPAGGWSIHVTDDHRAGASAPGQTIAISDGALATSSTTTRRWLRGEVAMHHIVDPRTGLPAQSVWRTVSVAATSCVDANTASTAAIVRGTTAVAWLAALGLPARLVDHDGRVVTVSGWPTPDAAETARP